MSNDKPPLAMYQFPFLVQCLESPMPRIQMWATYHLAHFWREEAHSFVGKLLDSSIAEVQESGAYLAGQHQMENLIFPLLRIFYQSEGETKQAAADALAQLQYRKIETPLVQWLETQLHSEEAYLPALESTASSLLVLDTNVYWLDLETRLSHFSNPPVTIALFSALVSAVNSVEQLTQLVQHYARLREKFTDSHFIQQFLRFFESEEIIDFLQMEMGHGFSVKVIYQECFRVLGKPLSVEAISILETVDQFVQQQDIHAICGELVDFLQQITPADVSTFELAFLQEFAHSVDDWDTAILQIQDQEFYLILALPLIYGIRLTEQECREDPKNHISEIAHLYHSPLLRKEFMKEIISLLFAQNFNIEKKSRDWENLHHAKEVLWNLATAEMPKIQYAFPAHLPKPWQYDIPAVLRILSTIYHQHFDHLVSSGQHEQIDYALAVFRRAVNAEIVECLLRHFPILINQHFHFFFEFIEYVPDRRFLPLLEQYYQQGEKEIGQLIVILSEIHQESHSVDIHDLEDSPPMNDQPSVRILCSSCGRSYQYSLKLLYYDSEQLEQRQPFVNESLWIAEKLKCKHCEADLPLITEDTFRSHLYAEMLTARLLKLSPEEEERIQRFKGVVFPRYFGRKMNPELFLKKAQQFLKQETESPKKKSLLLQEMGKFYYAIEEWDQAEVAFRQSLNFTGNQPVSLYHLGVIAFAKKNLPDARLYFSRILHSYRPEQFEMDDENIYVLSKHYLEILDRKEIRRASFKIISS